MWSPAAYLEDVNFHGVEVCVVWCFSFWPCCWLELDLAKQAYDASAGADCEEDDTVAMKMTRSAIHLLEETVHKKCLQVEKQIGTGSPFLYSRDDQG